MKIKAFIKMIIDIVMTFLMIACMSGLMSGDLLHEVFGSVMTALFILHIILNWKWYANIFKGKYSVISITWTVINILCLVSLIAQGVSGIVLSNYVFIFLNFESGFSLARKVHLACGYWSLIFVSLHLGLHWSMIAGKIGLNRIKSKIFIWTTRILFVAISIFGIYAFFKNNLLSYMFLKNHFAFFNYEQPRILFYMEYVSIMILFITIGHYSRKILHIVSFIKYRFVTDKTK